MANRRGGTRILLVLFLPVVLAAAAYSINVVYMQLVRTQLQANQTLPSPFCNFLLTLNCGSSPIRQSVICDDRALALYFRPIESSKIVGKPITGVSDGEEKWRERKTSNPRVR